MLPAGHRRWPGVHCDCRSGNATRQAHWAIRAHPLALADLVAAMDHTVVAASETITDGATFHFVLDPGVACSEYAPRTQAPKAFGPTTSGRVGRVGASRRAA